MTCMIHCKGSEEAVRTFSRGWLSLIISQNPQVISLKLYQNDTPAARHRFNEVLGIQPAASLNNRLQKFHSKHFKIFQNSDL